MTVYVVVDVGVDGGGGWCRNDCVDYGLVKLGGFRHPNSNCR